MYAVPLSSDPCTIELRSYGSHDSPGPLISYIKINNVSYNGAMPRGITVGKVLTHDGVCEVVDVLDFDTYSGGIAEQFRDWLNALTYGTTVVGVSMDEASSNIGPASSALAALGIDVSSYGYRWRLAFVAYVGKSEDTEMLVQPPGGPAILSTLLKGEFLNRFI